MPKIFARDAQDFYFTCVKTRLNLSKFLITGAAGFIGSHLCRALANRFEGEIHVLLRDQTDPWRLVDLNDRLITHHCDLRDANRLQDVVKDVNPKFVYNCASPSGHPQNSQEALLFLQHGVSMTTNLLQALLAVKDGIIVHLCSSLIYDASSGALTENSVRLPTCYRGLMKNLQLELIRFYRKRYDMRTHIVRIFRAYGVSEPSERLLYSLFRALQGDHEMVLADEKVQRDYVHIDDVVDCLLKLFEFDFKAGVELNVGSGLGSSAHHICSIVEEIGRGTIRKSSSNYKSPADRGSCVADISAAWETLQWKPKRLLKEGIRQMYNSYMNQSHNP